MDSADNKWTIFNKTNRSRSVLFQLSKALIDEDNLVLSTFPVEHAILVLAFVGLTFCILSNALYFIFGVYRYDNFWIPTLASFYLVIFLLTILAVLLEAPTFLQPLLIVQISVACFTLMGIVIYFLMATIIQLNGGSSTFFNEWETDRKETPFVVLLAAKINLIYICIGCSFGLPLLSRTNL